MWESCYNRLIVQNSLSKHKIKPPSLAAWQSWEARHRAEHRAWGSALCRAAAGEGPGHRAAGGGLSRGQASQCGPGSPDQSAAERAGVECWGCRPRARASGQAGARAGEQTGTRAGNRAPVAGSHDISPQRTWQSTACRAEVVSYSFIKATPSHSYPRIAYRTHFIPVHCLKPC